MSTNKYLLALNDLDQEEPKNRPQDLRLLKHIISNKQEFVKEIINKIKSMPREEDEFYTDLAVIDMLEKEYL